jgi:hypothetical protein
MAYASISKPSLHFNTKLTTGTGSSQAVTGLGFQPDWIWGKRRDSTGHHSLFDVVRGITKGLEANSAAGQFTSSDYYSSFDSDGFTIAAGSGGAGNGSSQTAAQWCWKAGNSAGSANSDGATATTVSANQTAGFSIVKHTGTGSATTLGHGLNAVPKMIFSKNLADSASWVVYHQGIGNTHYMSLNNDGGTSDNTMWNDTTPTSSVFSIGNHNNNNDSSDEIIHYVFAEKKGYSKFGTYKGNGDANGTFIYTGFKPAFILLKDSTSVVSWTIYDDQRSSSGNNPTDKIFHPNNSNAENTADDIDIVSNGFKCRTSVAGTNKNNATFIYMAFAAEPLVANVGASIPATAR